MNPITLAQLNRHSNHSLTIAFKLTQYVPGFEYAHLLVAERDLIQDQWTLDPSAYDMNGVHISGLKYNRKSQSSERGSVGHEDDIGSRVRTIRLNPHGWTSAVIEYRPDQSDHRGEGSSATLEFYGVISIVAAIDHSIPIMQFGDTVTTPTLIVPAI